jgi:hypothetical protein
MRGHTRGPGSRHGRPAPAGPPLYGLAEIAELVNYPRTNKLRLRAQLPPADVELRMGPIWYAATIERWLQTTDVRRVTNHT